MALSPERPCDLGMSSCSPATLAGAVAKLGVHPVCWAIEQGRAAAEHIAQSEPPIDGGGVTTEQLRRGSEAAVLYSLLWLAEPPAERPRIADESLAGVRDLVRRAIPLDQMLRGIRAGHADLASAYLRACERLVLPERHIEQMKAVNDDLFTYVDAFTDDMTRTYLDEHARWVTSVAAARVETVHGLLDGTVSDSAAARRTLGYDLDRTHVGAIVWADAADDSRLHTAAGQLLTACSAAATLVVPVGTGRVWAWGSVPEDATRETSAPVLGDGVYAAIGTPAPGLAGFRRTHRDALRVEELRTQAPRGTVTRYRDVVLTALLSRDLAAAGEFVRGELGDLGAPSEGMRALRTTLLRYLEAERSLIRVAEQVHIARGTVSYRVKRAQEILGYDVGERLFPLYAALLLADELGDAVLRAA